PMAEKRGKPGNATTPPAATAPAATAPAPATAPDDRDWLAYWRTLGQPWRTEPEISPERHRVPAARRALQPDIMQGSYPFGGRELALTRADVEWLLVTHEEGCGPVNWADPAQRTREGLDLRGADLSGVDLHGLPLASLRGGLVEDEWRNA